MIEFEGDRVFILKGKHKGERGAVIDSRARHGYTTRIRLDNEKIIELVKNGGGYLNTTVRYALPEEDTK